MLVAIESLSTFGCLFPRERPRKNGGDWDVKNAAAHNFVFFFVSANTALNRPRTDDRLSSKTGRLVCHAAFELGLGTGFVSAYELPGLSSRHSSAHVARQLGSSVSQDPKQSFLSCSLLFDCDLLFRRPCVCLAVCLAVSVVVTSIVVRPVGRETAATRLCGGEGDRGTPPRYWFGFSQSVVPVQQM